MIVGAEAADLDVVEWIGEPHPLKQLRGRVVLVETFQMLCPGCVAHGIPQAKRVQARFPDVVVLGLHTVFEHHDAMTPVALRAFLSEYQVTFPVGVDRHDGEPMPVTMRRYRLQGTPSMLLIDRQGRLRFSDLGIVDDMYLGARLARLLDEPGEAAAPTGPADAAAGGVLDGPTTQPVSGASCRPDLGCS